MKRLQSGAIALTALALSMLAAPGAQAARSEFYGIVQGPSLDGTDLQTISATGIRAGRFLLSWKRIEPQRGHRDWRTTDRLVGGLASRGIRGTPVAWGSPSWTRTGASARPPVNTPSAEKAWGDFLKAAVARYGPGGIYWSETYQRQFGESAVPLPIHSWQVWNEPNLRPGFHPGDTVAQTARKYAELLRISHDAIKAKDHQAMIVTAGIATQKDPHAFDFLDDIYSVPDVKSDFDAVAQHPYASSADSVRTAIQHVRGVMARNGDAATPLWITEFGWGSAPPDGSGINVGPAGQAQLLTRTINLILAHRSAWNVQRLYWFDWRDPAPGSPYADICIRCGSAGLFAHDRTPKPAFDAYRAFTADVSPPTASITKGPHQGALINNPTPVFAFASSEAGSTFVCRIDSGLLKQCATPFKAPRLSNGPHSFSVKAIDAAGNESAPVSRSFTVDALPPATPVITATSPASPANDGAPEVKGSAEAGSTVRLYETVGCTGAAAARGPASRFAGQGLTDSVPDNATTRFRATATDAAGNVSPCSSAWTYAEDSVAPQTTITAGPVGATAEPMPTFSFSSSEPHSTFECRLDSEPFAACSGPGASHAPAMPLSLGLHTFEVRGTDAALNTDSTPASRAFTVAP